MVDKKLSEFSQITPDEIAKLICLFLDENNAIKNGVVDFSALDNLIVHKDGAETIPGNKTFSGDSVFEGQATFNETVNANISGTAAKATADASGNTITSTYLTKTGTAAKATADASGNTITSTYATKTELSDKIQKVSTAPASPTTGVLYVIQE